MTGFTGKKNSPQRRYLAKSYGSPAACLGGEMSEFLLFSLAFRARLWQTVLLAARASVPVH
jgi:hypothetical protein